MLALLIAEGLQVIETCPVPVKGRPEHVIQGVLHPRHSTFSILRHMLSTACLKNLRRKQGLLVACLLLQDGLHEGVATACLLLEFMP